MNAKPVVFSVFWNDNCWPKVESVSAAVGVSPYMMPRECHLTPYLVPGTYYTVHGALIAKRV